MRTVLPVGLHLAVLGAVLIATAPGAAADFIATAPVAESAAAPAAEAQVAERLAGLGLSAPEAEARIVQLTPEELARIGESPEQAQMAGIYGWEIAAIACGMVLLGWLLWWLLHVHEKKQP
ncbi:MAG: hypothetical protein HZA54_19830 [Planctomycetes bacterium]|nr:hypothetical protein [Planctomycetota bacterium]